MGRNHTVGVHAGLSPMGGTPQVRARTPLYEKKVAVLICGKLIVTVCFFACVAVQKKKKRTLALCKPSAKSIISILSTLCSAQIQSTLPYSRHCEEN